MTKILLVEDDMALAIGVEYTLKQENYEVKRAKNLKEARENFKRRRIRFNFIRFNAARWKWI